MPTKLWGHPIHPMLIVFPVGLLPMSLIFDIIGMISDNGNWHVASYYMIGAGLLMGLVAAVFGFMDWSGLPDGTKAKRIGVYHMSANLVVVVLFIISWLTRNGDAATPDTISILMSLFGVAVLSYGGWQGGTMVYKLGAAVDEPQEV